MNKLIKILTTIGLVVFVSAAACTQSVTKTTDTQEKSTGTQTVIETTDTQVKPTGTEHVVVIDDNSFTPEEISVQVGDTVIWTNQGSESHTVTSWYSWINEKYVHYTIVGQTWDSGDIQSGESYSRTFESSGSYNYVSLPLFHYEVFDAGLMGIVFVE